MRIYRLRLLLLFALLLYAAGLRAQLLIPYTDGGKWGYSDTKGQVVFPPQWHSAGFFEGDKARVTVTDSPMHQPYTCIIDRSGRYIVPPERHWNGQWNGFEETGLNARDSSGRFGMIDTLNRVIVPFEYEEAMQFYVRPWKGRLLQLRKRGKWGVIDRECRTIVPFRWTHLSALQAPGHPLAYEAEAAPGQPHALLDSAGREVVPAGYFNYAWAESRTIKGYTADRVEHQSRKRGFFAWPSGKPVIPPDYDQVQLTQGGFFIAFRRGEIGVLDTSARVVIPFSHARIYEKGDSLIQTEDVTSSDAMGWGLAGLRNHRIGPVEEIADSIIRNERYFDARTAQAITGWQRVATYNDYRRYDGPICGTGRAMFRDGLTFSSGPSFFIGGRNVDSFWLDGRTWYWSGWADEHRGMYAVSDVPYKVNRMGPVNPGNVAIVDRNLRFIAGPYAGVGKITHFNEEAGLLVCYVHNPDKVTEGKPANRHTLRRKSGARVLGTDDMQIISSVLIRGKIHMLADFTTVRTETGPNGYRKEVINRAVRLCDASLHPVPGKSRFILIHPAGKNGLETENSDIFFATDSLGREGFVNMAGEVMWPRISFVHSKLRAIGGGLFAIPNGDRNTTVVNTEGIDVFPAIRVTSVHANSDERVKGHKGANGEPIRLHLVYYDLPADRRFSGSLSFYVDDSGRAYTSGFERMH